MDGSTVVRTFTCAKQQKPLSTNDIIIITITIIIIIIRVAHSRCTEQ